MSVFLYGSTPSKTAKSYHRQVPAGIPLPPSIGNTNMKTSRMTNPALLALKVIVALLSLQWPLPETFSEGKYVVLREINLFLSEISHKKSSKSVCSACGQFLYLISVIQIEVAIYCIVLCNSMNQFEIQAVCCDSAGSTQNSVI